MPAPLSPSTGLSELVGRCQNGDLDAFDLLVERYQTRIYNLCFWQLRDADEASDAAQEVFIRAWRSVAKFRGDCAFSTWLHRIAINVTHDAARRRGNAPVAFSAVLSNEEGDESESIANLTPDEPASRPAEVAQRGERQRAVQNALASLPDHHRVVLVLFDIEGHSYEDVSAMLELPMGTVKSRLNRARAALREKLESCRELFED
ncbi:MAG TPA: sigma-70 family RNA polymerase sigma factor [Abditibacteriaceae bacterium]